MVAVTALFVGASCSVRPHDITGGSVDDPEEGSYVSLRNYSNAAIRNIVLNCEFYLFDKREFSKTVRIAMIAPNEEVRIRSGFGRDIKAECKPALSMFLSGVDISVGRSQKWSSEGQYLTCGGDVFWGDKPLDVNGKPKASENECLFNGRNN